jgi:UDP-glucose:O-linked fucose beta-1,3-glucosyltransferase
MYRDNFYISSAYFSVTYLFTDASVPTIDLGVPNTEHGHCGKTMAILKHIALIASSVPDIRWAVVADDDTILR